MPADTPAPQLPLFVFDGDCGFCRRWARWLERQIPGVATFVASQSVDVEGLGLSRDLVASASYWVDERGRTFRGNRSFTHALRRTRGPARWVAAALDAPPLRWHAALAYRLVVRHRRTLPAPR